MIEVGSVVRLNSGSLRMTVTDLPLGGGVSKPYALVSWVNDDGTKGGASFPLVCLTLLREETASFKTEPPSVWLDKDGLPTTDAAERWEPVSDFDPAILE